MVSCRSHYEKRIDAKGRVLSDECIEDEIPFEIPKSWEWARLETLSSVLNGDRGKNYPAKSSLHSEGIPFVSAVNISNEIVVEDDLLCMNENQYSALRAGILSKGDFVFCIRGSLGKFGVFPLDKGAIASSLVIVRSHMASWQNDGWLQLLLGSPLTKLQIELKDNGTAQPNLSAKDFSSFLYAIPPLAEQRRIVRHLKEAALYIEEFGKLEAAREQLDEELPDRLRKSVLQQAVQGRLVPQDPADEPASVPLGRIREERRRLIAEGKLKAPKGGESVIYRASDGSYYEKRVDAKGREGEPVCIDDEIPFEIPDSWEWARLSTVFNLARGNGIKRTEVTESGKPCVRYGELYTTYKTAILKPASFTNQRTYDKAQKLLDGEVVVTLTGENDIDIGRAVVNNAGEVIAYGGDLLALKGGCINGNFTMYSLNSPYMSLQRTSAASGNIIVHLSGSRIGNFLIAIPPRHEQIRIVEQLDALVRVFI